MGISWAVIVIVAVMGIIFGIIGGALWMIISQMRAGRKARKDFKKENIINIKNNPTEEVPEKKKTDKQIKKQIDKSKETKPTLPEMPVPKPEPKLEERDYKKDLKLFNKANKKLIKLKKMHDKGKLTNQELKQEFGYYQSQDYYKHILEKDYAKK